MSQYTKLNDIFVNFEEKCIFDYQQEKIEGAWLVSTGEKVPSLTRNPDTI